MPLITEELSVWDIGLRWSGHDPDRLWLRLPLEAKDYFRLMMEAILSGEIICDTLALAKLPPGSRADPRFYIRTYIDEVHACIFGRRYDRKLLKWAAIDRMDFHQWCERRGITPPEFWFPPGWKLEYASDDPLSYPGCWVRHLEPDAPGTMVSLKYDPPDMGEDGENDVSQMEIHTNISPGESDNSPQIEELPSLLAEQSKNEKALRDCQRIKLVCQQIASVIWEEDKSRTIASVVKDELVQKYGGASFYQDETVREWLKEVAPREVKNRRGRPRKNGDSDDQV
ncbi:hypothetical protein MTYP_03157 [Methylophilaceae bacterium]|nr:hypothetical protein MTYP_03157 [Methylophilaceae bacterium]